ncbi:MAG: iron-sulfur cluster assembly accessory protein [Proteobacteria bacterium]|nr:iron-sulfur cluster assembly accessory protein [Pseudomonadota bacterium]
MKFDIASHTSAPAAPAPQAAPLGVSDSAAARLAVILAGEGAGAMMRVAVEGGGCSGFQYKFDIVQAAEPDDFVIEKGGIKVLVDATSAPLLAGSILDYVTELLGASFKIVNPNATASCGCGTSFSL